MKKGPKPKSKIKIEWSGNFAYALGLLATDGYVSKDGRHIDLTSNDRDQLENFMRCLGINVVIGSKTNGRGRSSYRVQLSDVIFREFIISIGIVPAKSLIMGKLTIPDEYFFDFLRGCFDGDGCTYSYWDPRWRSSYMFYISFASSSPIFIHWLKQTISRLGTISGHITRLYKRHVQYQLRYSKHEAVKLVEKMYTGEHISLARKKLKIDQSLAMISVPV